MATTGPPEDPPDTDSDDADEAGAPAESGAPIRSGKRFRAATDDELDPQSFMVSDDRAALRVRLEGGSIEKDRGDADFIGGAVRRLARALRAVAEVRRAKSQNIGPPQLRNVAFGASVVIELEISQDEDLQLQMDGTSYSPTIDAAQTLAALMAASADQVLPLALEIGGDAALEYKRFLNVLSEDDVTVEWLPKGATDYVVTTSIDARRDYTILDRPGEPRTAQVTVPGTLTMADSRRHRFELSLPSELKRPPILKGKSVVEGTYGEDVGVHVKTAGMWDTQVMATILVTYDAPGSTAIPRDYKYELLGAEPLTPPPTPPNLFDPPPDDGGGDSGGGVPESGSPDAGPVDEPRGLSQILNEPRQTRRDRASAVPQRPPESEAAAVEEVPHAAEAEA